MCSFYSNIEKELSVHLASKHTKYSEIEADESYYEVADDVIDKEIEEETRVADEESYDGDAANAVDKIRRPGYICCTDGCTAEHKGVICTERECCDDDCKVHLFTSIGDEVVEYEPTWRKICCIN